MDWSAFKRLTAFIKAVFDVHRFAEFAGPAPCVVLPTITKGAKTQKNGRRSFTGSIRHRFSELCAHNALAHHLCTRFTLGKAPFPNPRNRKEWNRTPMWPGNNPTKNLSYQQQRSAVVTYLRVELQIHTRKLVHAFRVLAARNLDMSGIDDHVSLLL